MIFSASAVTADINTATAIIFLLRQVGVARPRSGRHVCADAHRLSRLASPPLSHRGLRRAAACSSARFSWTSRTLRIAGSASALSASSHPNWRSSLSFFISRGFSTEAPHRSRHGILQRGLSPDDSSRRGPGSDFRVLILCSPTSAPPVDIVLVADGMLFVAGLSGKWLAARSAAAVPVLYL